MNKKKASKNIDAFLYLDIDLMVLKTFFNASFNKEVLPYGFIFSTKFLLIGSINANHQTETIRNDILMASSDERKPIFSQNKNIKAFIRKRNPPPR